MVRPPLLAAAATAGRTRALVATLLPSAALTFAGFALGLSLGAPQPVEAEIAGTTDLDFDGLADQVEWIVGTDPFEDDSDGDGFGDLEEFARQSDPLIGSSVPPSAATSVAILGRASSGLIDVVMPVYLPQSYLPGLDFEFGLRIGQTLTEVPPSVWLPMTTYQITTAANPADSILTLNLTIPQTLVSAFGGLSFYALVTPPGAPGPVSAGVLNLLQSGPVTLQTIGIPDNPSGLSSAYRPLNDPSEIPPSWSPGELCSRSTETIGVVGKVVIQEVVDARCEPADGYCIPTCSASIGEQEELLDPLVLIGG